MHFKEVSDFLEKSGQPSFRQKQWQQFYFKDKHLSFQDLTTFPLELRKQLEEQFGNRLLPLEPIEILEDEQAKKYLFQLEDGERIESVYMRFKDGIRSLCISTQVGCPCACRFCATGGIGFKRNLTLDEILGQVLYVAKTNEGLDRITVMGMGEALLNPHILEALNIVSNPQGFGLSAHRISVSTVGIVEGIRKLNEHCPHVTLTFSLHFPDQKLREQWMPMAKKYPLEAIFEALDERVRKTKRKIYLAYTLLEGVNNRKEDLDKLEAIFQQRGDLRYLYHVNLIPFHAIPNLPVPETSRAAAIHFQKQLEQRHIEATVRQSFGKSIQGACGQLAAGYRKRL